MYRKFALLVVAMLVMALIGMIFLVILATASGTDPLINGGFEQGRDGWTVESNPGAFNVDCRFGDPVEGNCLLQAGILRGTDEWIGINSLVQTIDTTKCATPHLIFYWDFYNNSPDPEQDELLISANDAILFRRWNGNGVGYWQKEEFALPAGIVKLAITSRVKWRLHMTYMKLDGFQVICPNDLIPWAYLPQVGSAAFGPPTPPVPEP